MKFITVRDLATKNKETRKKISQGDSVLTLNGKPIAYMIPVNEDNFEWVVNETMRLRAISAVETIQKKAAKLNFTEADIERIINDVRRKAREKRYKKK
jgi:antitoxin (DNA-binding transcriptional repressor) of toxin-antitoxin stability system